ncbi:hypothetical protein HPP92_010964 [Vanilla planifolia]|uniref:Uncharacterized protein n=1 Tax=Vanilla planifolia TaxID=51239 RepID=A0A835R7I4_VANPL|nr:hypothetical protein HPP92_010964 [Vanilla planifolia]
MVADHSNKPLPYLDTIINNSPAVLLALHHQHRQRLAGLNLTASLLSAGAAVAKEDR